MKVFYINRCVLRERGEGIPRASDVFSHQKGLLLLRLVLFLGVLIGIDGVVVRKVLGTPPWICNGHFGLPKCLVRGPITDL